jgi:hypothetical protein
MLSGWQVLSRLLSAILGSDEDTSFVDPCLLLLMASEAFHFPPPGIRLSTYIPNFLTGTRPGLGGSRHMPCLFALRSVIQQPFPRDG